MYREVSSWNQMTNCLFMALFLWQNRPISNNLKLFPEHWEGK